MATPVIFRKWKKSESIGAGDDIIALFPAEPGTLDPYTCNSYEHTGQHGSADPVGVIQRTDPATPDEYADLKKELESIGYDDLVVYSRLQSSFIDARRKALAKYEPKKKAKKQVRHKHPATSPRLRSMR